MSFKPRPWDRMVFYEIEWFDTHRVVCQHRVLSRIAADEFVHKLKAGKYSTYEGLGKLEVNPDLPVKIIRIVKTTIAEQ